jgi:CrcB protein
LTSSSSFPAGTLAVNVLGSLALGLLMGATVAGSVSMSPRLRVAIAVGGLGAFTTFSTFAYETVEALRVGDLRNAVLATALNLVLAVSACWLGAALGERL